MSESTPQELPVDHGTPQELIEAALAVATLPVVAVVTVTEEVNLRWANNALTTNGEMRRVTATVTASAPVEGGVAVGTASEQLVEVDGIAGLVAQAEAMARNGSPTEDAAPLVESVAEGDGAAEGWSHAPTEAGIEVLAEVAAALGSAFETARRRDQLLFGFAELIVSTCYLGTTTGLRRRGAQPTGRFELNGKAADLSASAWAGRPTRDFSDVDVAQVHAEVTERLGWASRRIDLPPGRYETLLPPGAVADLLIYAYWNATARDAEEGRNVFAASGGRTRVGEKLAELPLEVWSDPSYPGLETVGFVHDLFTPDGTAWAIDGGLPIKKTTWIADGVLTELIRNRAHAVRTDQAPTPPPDNLIMDGGGAMTLAEMISSTKRGLLLTCLWYIREVDPQRLLLTGLTRDGVYLIEDGAVVGAVNNFRFNESPVELLGRVSEVGATESTLCREWNDYFTRTVMPAIRVPDFNMSTVSQAS